MIRGFFTRKETQMTIEDILAIIVLVILVFGGLAGCIVKYLIYRGRYGKDRDERGEE